VTVFSLGDERIVSMTLVRHLLKRHRGRGRVFLSFEWGLIALCVSCTLCVCVCVFSLSLFCFFFFFKCLFSFVGGKKGSGIRFFFCSGAKDKRPGKSHRDGWRARRGKTGVCVCVCVWERERDLERLLKLHPAQGKSNQAISEPRRSAPATFAPHNYNTIWQRYWARVPCCRCGCACIRLQPWFYIKGPPKKRNGINTDLLKRSRRSKQNTSRGYVDSPEPWRDSTECDWRRRSDLYLFNSPHRRPHNRAESQERKEQLLWTRRWWGERGKTHGRLLCCNEKQKFGLKSSRKKQKVVLSLFFCSSFSFAHEVSAGDF